MDEELVLYICPSCYRVCDQEGDCHDQTMTRCYPGRPGSFHRKPIADRYGIIHSQAPRWFLDAIGWSQARGRFTPYGRMKAEG